MGITLWGWVPYGATPVGFLGDATDAVPQPRCGDAAHSSCMRQSRWQSVQPARWQQPCARWGWRWWLRQAVAVG